MGHVSKMTIPTTCPGSIFHFLRANISITRHILIFQQFVYNFKKINTSQTHFVFTNLWSNTPNFLIISSQKGKMKPGQPAKSANFFSKF